MTHEEIEKLLCANDERIEEERLQGENYDEADHLFRMGALIRHLLQAQRWRPIEEAKHDTWFLLAEPPPNHGREWTLKVGKASWGERPGTRSWAGYATHFMPLPEPPSSFEEPKATPSAQPAEGDHDTKKT